MGRGEGNVTHITAAMERIEPVRHLPHAPHIHSVAERHVGVQSAWRTGIGTEASAREFYDQKHDASVRLLGSCAEYSTTRAFRLNPD